MVKARRIKSHRSDVEPLRSWWREEDFEVYVETLKAVETDKLAKPWAWPDIEELEEIYGNIPGYTTAKKNAEAGICRW